MIAGVPRSDRDSFSLLLPDKTTRFFTTIRAHAERTGAAVVLITHRMASVRMADRIYVLDQGRVIERGTHSELMAAEGRYHELFTLQADAYTDPAPNP